MSTSWRACRHPVLGPPHDVVLPAATMKVPWVGAVVPW